MKKQSLNKHCHDFYEDQELSQHKLEQLIALNESINADQNKISILAKKTKNTWRSIAAAAFIGILFSFGLQQYTSNTTSPNSKLVHLEIALNHSKHLALEFNSNNYSELNKMMPKLGFKLKTSNNFQLANLTIQGSRYCSIQGNLAAQIRLTDIGGNSYTLYQTPLTAALTIDNSGTFTTGGITITQWQEDNIFFGLARSSVTQNTP